jgi:hypothetical protein
LIEEDDGMADYIWCWRIGDRTIYTQRYEKALQAKRAGYFVSVVPQKNHVYQ